MLKKIAWQVLVFLLTVLLVGFALRHQTIRGLANALRQVNYYPAIFIFMLSALAQLLRASRWNMQLDAAGARCGYWRVYHALMAGNLVNVVTPQLGEITRCTMLRRSTGVPLKTGFGSVVAEHAVDFICLVLAVLLALFVGFESRPGFVNAIAQRYFTLQSWLLYAFILVAIPLLTGLALLYLRSSKSLWLRDTAGYRYTVSFINGMLSGAFALRKMENKGRFILLTLLTWTLYYARGIAAFYMLSQTLHLGFREGISVLAFGTLAMWAPVQGGFGIFQVLVQAALMAYGVSSQAALLCSIVLHGVQTLQVVLMGGFSLFAGLRAKPLSVQPADSL